MAIDASKSRLQRMAFPGLVAMAGASIARAAAGDKLRGGRGRDVQ